MEERITRCRDCRHFQTDVWVNYCGIPIIAAHEMCMKWGGGCKTSPDGYCYMAERKEGTDEQGHEEKDRVAPIRL